jgi:DNA-binding phage protein
MTAPDQVSPLLAAARQRHDDARRRAVAALRRLDSTGEPINFAAVAREAGVSRAWLYRQDDLRAETERLTTLAQNRQTCSSKTATPECPGGLTIHH